MAPGIAIVVGAIKPLPERRVPLADPLHDATVRALAIALRLPGIATDYALHAHAVSGRRSRFASYLGRDHTQVLSLQRSIAIPQTIAMSDRSDHTMTACYTLSCAPTPYAVIKPPL